MTSKKRSELIADVDLSPVPVTGHPRLAMMPGKDFVSESFHPAPGNQPKVFEESDAPEIKGVVLKGAKGVVNEIIPSKHIPIDAEGNKAELLMHAEEADDETYALPYLGADYEGNVAFTRPRQLKRSKNHQRHGYSKRKAKRHASWNCVYKARFKERATRLMGWMESCSELKFDKEGA